MNGVNYGLVTGDGVIGTSGTPKVIYGMSIVNNSGGNGVVNIRNGALVSDPIVIRHTMTVGADSGEYVPISDVGLMLGDGCFVDIDANVEQVALFYREVI